MSTAYGGTGLALTGRARGPLPRGLRRLAVALWFATAASGTVAVGAFLTDRHVAATAPVDVAEALHGPLLFEVVAGVVALLLVGLCAALVRRPSENARAAACVIAALVFALFLVVASTNAGTVIATHGDSTYADALPGWYGVIQGAELAVMAVLAATLLLVPRRRFRDFYNSGGPRDEAAMLANVPYLGPGRDHVRPS